MPEFYRKNGVVGRVRYRETGHNRVHAHFAFAEFELVVFITPRGAEIAEGELPKPKMRQVMSDLQDPQLRQEALEIWPK